MVFATMVVILGVGVLHLPCRTGSTLGICTGSKFVNWAVAFLALFSVDFLPLFSPLEVVAALFLASFPLIIMHSFLLLCFGNCSLLGWFTHAPCFKLLFSFIFLNIPFPFCCFLCDDNRMHTTNHMSVIHLPQGSHCLYSLFLPQFSSAQ
jgi:hypothetical protein